MKRHWTHQGGRPQQQGAGSSKRSRQAGQHHTWENAGVYHHNAPPWQNSQWGSPFDQAQGFRPDFSKEEFDGYQFNFGPRGGIGGGGRQDFRGQQYLGRQGGTSAQGQQGCLREGHIRAAVFQPPFDEDDEDGAERIASQVQRGPPGPGQVRTNPSLCLTDPFLPSESRVRAFLSLCREPDDSQAHRAMAGERGKGARPGLTRELWDMFRSERQSPGTMRNKVALWLDIDTALRTRWRSCRTLAFGSTLSGLGTDSSDMDLCVFCDHEGVGRKKGDVDFLVEVRKILR